MILYGIKNCDMIKKAKNWLEQHHVNYQYHDFRTDGVTIELLNDWIARSDWNVLLNRNSHTWKKLTPEQQTKLANKNDLSLILEMPTLLKRPILDTGTALIFGFNAVLYAEKLQ